MGGSNRVESNIDEADTIIMHYALCIKKSPAPEYGTKLAFRVTTQIAEQH